MKLTERSGLIMSTIGNLTLGVVGVTIALVNHSQAILLDGVFNLTYVGTGLFTLKVAELITRGDDERFPAGYGFFEPLINGIKGMMLLGVSLLALIGAIEALYIGGKAVSPGLASVYGAIATTSCFTLAFVTRKAANKTGSPLLKADADNWLVNGAISSAVLLAFVSIFFIRGTKFDIVIPYVDPVLVILVVSISISVPIRMAWNALMELLNRAPSEIIRKQVEEVVIECLEELPVKELFVRVLQPGRSRIVAAHVVLPADYQVGSLSSLDAIRSNTLIKLQEIHPSTIVDLVFTSDRNWGAFEPDHDLPHLTGPLPS